MSLSAILASITKSEPPPLLILPNCVPPSLKIISAPSASRIISPATSIVKSPLDKSISVPSIVMLSIDTPASAVTAPVTPKVPDISALPLISIVVAFSSNSVSDTKSKTPSADWWM